MAAKKGRRTIPANVKQNAIAKVRAGERRADVAKELGVSLPTIHNWMAAAGGTGKRRAGPVKGGRNDELELLRLENEYLKKKITYLETRSK